MPHVVSRFIDTDFEICYHSIADVVSDLSVSKHLFNIYGRSHEKKVNNIGDMVI